MVKFKYDDFKNAKNSQFSGFDGALFYGQDKGQIFDYFNETIKIFVSDVNDAFSVFEFTSKQIEEDPSKLIDEATAISFLGGKKVIKIRDASEAIVDTIKDLLKEHEHLEAFLVITADELGTTSKLRTLFEYNKRLFTLPCYIDDDKNLPIIIKQCLMKEGIKFIPNDVINFLTSRFGENRSTTKSELEKIALYLHGKNSITLEDAEKCIMDTSYLNLQDLPLVVAEGSIKKLSMILPRLFAEGIFPIQILKIVSNHFKYLYSLFGEIESGKTKEEVLKPIFWKIHGSYEKQLDVWNPEKILRVIFELNETTIRCMVSGAPQEILVSQILFTICTIANKRK